MRTRVWVLLVLALAACSGSGGSAPDVDRAGSKAALGERLYSDVNLSLNRTQSCATCHNLDHAFIDDRRDALNDVPAVSLGDDGVSLGDRNAPTAGYAGFAPDFVANGARDRPHTHNTNRAYTGALGGQFVDGRAIDLKDQAARPPINPIEMGMPDRASVVVRIQEDAFYVASFEHLYGEDIFDDVDAAYEAMADSIGEFEKIDAFASFDSKYDRSLRGDYTMTFKELTGKALFFSSDANCNVCHQLHAVGDPLKKFQEVFTGFEYHNIGVPENTAVRDANGVTGPDIGLEATTGNASDKGKFKVPGLRNVAVTAPYMHNGVFRELNTVVEFYLHRRDEGDVDHRVNPETGAAWEAPEVAENISTAELGMGEDFSDDQREAMVCFLRLLTDQRYEHLIEPGDIGCD